MKFLAVLQIICILFLSSYPGMVKAEVQTAKLDCCKKFNKTDNCRQKKNEQKDNCNNGGCSMLLTCGICGLLAIEPTAVKPANFIIIEQPVAIYKFGNSTGYFPADWKPPKV